MNQFTVLTQMKFWTGAGIPAVAPTGDGKIGRISAGLYSATNAIITLGKIGKP